MNDTTRIILLVLFNASLVAAFYAFSAWHHFDIEQIRLIDLDFGDQRDLSLMAAFGVMILAAIVGNIVIFAWPSQRNRIIRQLIARNIHI